MDRETLSLVLASTMGGLAVLLATVSLVYQPLLLPFSLPLAAGAYLMWQGALARVGRGRVRWQEVDPDEWADGEAPGSGRSAPGFGANRGPAAGRGARARGRVGRDSANRYRQPGESGDDAGRSRAQAYRVLGLDPGADEQAVKRAYRERVKEVHPDAPEGDEARFRRVNRAYETLTDG